MLPRVGPRGLSTRSNVVQPILAVLALCCTARSTSSSLSVDGRLFQSFDGVGANPRRPQWGAAGGPRLYNFTRAPHGRESFEVGPHLGPNPRNVSNLLLDKLPRLSRSHSAFLPAWGQLISHDMLGTFFNTSDSMLTSVPRCDPHFDPECTGSKHLPVHGLRSTRSPSGGRLTLNSVSAFLDGSALYGTSAATAATLRTGVGGRVDLDSAGLPRIAGQLPTGPGGTSRPITKLGDPRGNVSPQQLVLHTVFMREHNRKAAAFARDFPQWSDERLFHESRAWVRALVQHITIGEYLREVLGSSMSVPAYTGFNEDTDPSIDIFWATVALRYGHGALTSIVPRRDASFAASECPHLAIDGTIMNAAPTLEVHESHDMNRTEPDPIASIIRGLVTQPEGHVGPRITPPLRNGLPHSVLPLFAPRDIVVANIVRGRYENVLPYNQARAAFGLQPQPSWDALVSHFPTEERARVRAAAESLYGSVDALDPWVGGLLEGFSSGAMGPLFKASMREQLLRTRAADPFWFERDGVLRNTSEVASVRATRLSDVVRRNSGAAWLPASLFSLSSTTIADTSFCDGIPCSNAESGDSSTFGAQLTPDYRVEWAIREEEGIIDLTLTFSGLGNSWMGIGFGQSVMRDVDIVMCGVGADGIAWALDAYSPGDRPYPDIERGGSDSIVEGSVSGSVVDGVTRVAFSRPLNAEDSVVDTSIEPGDMDIIFAWSTVPFDPTNPAYHGQNRGTATIDFFTGASTCVQAERSNAIVVHAVIMFLAWCVMAPLGLISARYCRHKDWWLSRHERLLKLAGGGAVPVALTAFFDSKRQFGFLHSIVGISIALMVIVQGVFGVRTREGFKSSVHRGWHVLSRHAHRWLGRAMFGAALFNSWIGANRMFPETGGPAHPIRTAIHVWIGAIVLAMVVLEVHLRFVLPRQLEHGWKQFAEEDSAASIPTFTWADINDRVRAGAQWVVLDGFVLDLQGWIESHPGGGRVLTDSLGTDISAEFKGESSTRDLSALQNQFSLSRHDHLHASGPLTSGASESVSVATPAHSCCSRRWNCFLKKQNVHGLDTPSSAPLRNPAQRSSPHKHNAPAESTPETGLRKRNTGRAQSLGRPSLTQDVRIRAAAAPIRRARYKKRLHRHGPQAWRKVSSIIVGRVATSDSDRTALPAHLASGSGSSIRPRQRGAFGGSFHPKNARDSVRQHLHDGIAGREGTDEVKLSRASQAILYRLVEADATQYRRYTLLEVSILTPRSNAPLAAVRLVAPAGTVLSTTLPGTHFYVQGKLGSQLVERPYTAMLLFGTDAPVQGPAIVEQWSKPMRSAHEDGGSPRPVETQDEETGRVHAPEMSSPDQSQHGHGGTKSGEPRTRVLYRGGSGMFGAMEVERTSSVRVLGGPPTRALDADETKREKDTEPQRTGGHTDAWAWRTEEHSEEGEAVPEAEAVAGGDLSSAAGAPHGYDDVPSPSGPLVLDLVVKLYPSGSMSSIFREMEPLGELRVRGPVGKPIVCPTTRSGAFHHLGLVAGGAGITPMLQIIDYFLAYAAADALDIEGSHPSGGIPTRISLLYANSSPDDVAPELVQRLAHAEHVSGGRVRVAYTVSRPDDRWRGLTGRVDLEKLSALMPPVPGLTTVTATEEGAGQNSTQLAECDRAGRVSGHDAEGDDPLAMCEHVSDPLVWTSNITSATTKLFLCGPPSMMDAVAVLMGDAGVPEEFVVMLE